MLAKEKSDLASESENRTQKHDETMTMICEYPVKQVAVESTIASTSVTTTSSTRDTEPIDTSASKFQDYPVSSSGACPYCSSTDVKYIVLVDSKTKDSQLPQTLQILLKKGKAFKMAKGEKSHLCFSKVTLFFLKFFC